MNRNLQEITSLKDYIKLLLSEWKIVSLFLIAGIIGAVFYTSSSTEYYKSTASLKISKPKGDILTSPILPEFSDFGNDRFIANEIEIMKSQKTLRRAAAVISDSLRKNPDRDYYRLLVNRDESTGESTIASQNIISVILSEIDIEQKSGLDIIEVSFLSPSPEEAELIVNTFAAAYIELNKELTSQPLAIIRQYLERQRSEKEGELKEAEEELRKYRSAGKVFALNEQASILINQLAEFDAQKNIVNVDLATSDKVLTNLRQQLKEQDPRLADYLKSLSSQSYIKGLQDEIVKLELNREISQSRQPSSDYNPAVIAEYNSKIERLKTELNSQLKLMKDAIYSSSPEEVKELSQRILTEEVKKQSLQIKLSELERILVSYENSFNKLPKTSLELARYERNTVSLEKLYSQVEQRYQEALINEQSQPGNIIVIEEAEAAGSPSKPNKKLILFAGLALGIFGALGYVFMKNFIDDSIKNPEQVEKYGIEVLGWIEKGSNKNKYDFENNSKTSEALRSIRNRIQLVKNLDPSIKSLLITSAIPGEGKSSVAAYLAHSFAKSRQKVALIDCDLRKPKLHQILGIDQAPGIMDYFYGTAGVTDILRNTTSNKLQVITAGTVKAGDEDIFDNIMFKDLISNLKEDYDLIIIDSAPIIVVPETEILASITDSSLMVIAAHSAGQEVVLRALKTLSKTNRKFLGAVLNKFKYRPGYGNHYKYTYSYSSESSK
jgi:capsular exopolysaccharide synthesis family protein